MTNPMNRPTLHDVALEAGVSHMTVSRVLHGGRIAGPGWEPGTTAKRVIAWLQHSSVVLQGAEFAFYRAFLRSLAVQIRYLRSAASEMPHGKQRLRVRTALAFAALSLPAPASALRNASRNLAEELERQILPDGGHVSRNPMSIVELLADLHRLAAKRLDLAQHRKGAKPATGPPPLRVALRGAGRCWCRLRLPFTARFGFLSLSLQIGFFGCLGLFCLFLFGFLAFAFRFRLRRLLARLRAGFSLRQLLFAPLRRQRSKHISQHISSLPPESRQTGHPRSCLIAPSFRTPPSRSPGKSK